MASPDSSGAGPPVVRLDNAVSQSQRLLLNYRSAVIKRMRLAAGDVTRVATSAAIEPLMAADTERATS